MVGGEPGGQNQQGESNLLDGVGNGGQHNLSHGEPDRGWKVDGGTPEDNTGGPPSPPAYQGGSLLTAPVSTDQADQGGEQPGNGGSRQFETNFDSSHSSWSCHQGKDPMAQLVSTIFLFVTRNI